MSTVLRDDPELIASLRRDLESAGWTVEVVDSLLSDRSRAALERDQLVPALLQLEDHTSAVATLTRLFILADEVVGYKVSVAFPNLGISGAVALGLIRVANDRDRTYRAQVDLRPHTGQVGEKSYDWWVASDMSQAQTGEPPRDDYVLGIAAASTNLLRQTMRLKVDRALDLGCGSGILALYLSTHSNKVVATDISARACQFTRFNALLNEADIDVRQGSLFEPVEGEQFDLITSNPPFVITPAAVRKRANLEYRDGGLSRDHLIPLILSEAVTHLRDGGVVQMLANWEVGYRPERWDRRPRRWVEDAVAPILDEGGSAQAWVVQRDLVDVAQYAEWWMKDQWGDRVDRLTWDAQYREWLSDFARAGAGYIGLGSISVRIQRDHQSAGKTSGDTLTGSLEIVTENLPDGPPVNGEAVEVALDNLTVSQTWRDQPLQRATDVREVRYYVPGHPDPELIRVTQGRAGGRERTVTSAVAAFIGVCDGEVSAAQVVPIIAELLGIPVDQAWEEVEEAIAELLRSGVLFPPSSTLGSTGEGVR